MPKQRFDYTEFRARKTDEGFLIDSPKVARIGIQEYRNDDGSIRRELRLPEEVFHADSLASYYGKPITVDHPKKAVKSSNISKVQVGTMLAKGRQNNDDVETDIVVHQPDSIGDRRELSLGYECDLDETPGEWNGQRYDAIQRNIRVNHLSIVKRARAGAQARLNLDSDEEPLINEEINMPKIRLDNGIEYEASQEVIVEVEKLRKDAATVSTELATVKKAVDTLTAERDTLKARVDGIPAEVEKAVKTAQDGAKARTELESVAKNFKIDAKDKSDDEIKHAVIKSVNKDFDPAGKSADYVNAAFDMAKTARADTAMQTQRATVAKIKTEAQQRDDGEDDPREAWRNKLGSNAVTEKE